MHEMTLAVGIIDLAVQTAEQNKAKKINSITVEAGALAGILQDALEFCFTEAARNTIAENAVLKYHVIPAQAVCGACGKRFEALERMAKCPQCGTPVFEISGGTEMRVKDINVD